MPKKSPLSEKQWKEIERRYLENENVRALAREFKVSDTAIHKRFSLQTKQVKTVANQLLSAERAFNDLPPSLQIQTKNWLDDLRAMSIHVAGAVKYNAASAHRIAGIHNAIAEQIDDADPLAGKSGRALEAMERLADLSNDLLKAPIDLIKANKEVMAENTADENKLRIVGGMPRAAF